jgi:hypothetical protein
MPSLSSTLRLVVPATTWRFVRIQPLASKMIPEPTPCWVCWTTLFGSMPSVKIRTTDGLAFAATSMMADDSSRLTGCLTVAGFALELGACVTIVVRFRAPLAFNATTVPPDARMAAARAAASTVPVPLERRVGGAAGRAAAGPAASNQRSGARVCALSGSAQRAWAQSVRGSGAGEKEAEAVGGGGVTGAAPMNGGYGAGRESASAARSQPVVSWGWVSSSPSGRVGSVIGSGLVSW